MKSSRKIDKLVFSLIGALLAGIWDLSVYLSGKLQDYLVSIKAARSRKSFKKETVAANGQQRPSTDVPISTSLEYGSPIRVWPWDDDDSLDYPFYEFKVAIKADSDKPPLNKWYVNENNRHNPRWVRMYTTHTKNWRVYGVFPVAGITQEDRQFDLLMIASGDNPTITLEKEPSNRHDKNAIKVIIKNNDHRAHIGYLPMTVAKDLQDEPGLDARPSSLFIPPSKKYTSSLEVKVLTRSVRWRKANKPE